MYYGSDTGGTKIVLGVFDRQRRLQWETRVPAPRDNYGAFLDAVYNLVTEADRRFGIKGSVGIGAPGMSETEDGTPYAANVPAVSDKPLRADLSARLDRDVRLGSGTNYFALSEVQDDEFTQYPLVMGLIPDTGVDGGLVFNGKSITGCSYITGEFGHIRLPADALTPTDFDFLLRRCGCGQLECIGSYLPGGGSTWLYQYYYHQPLDAREVIALWEQGGKRALAHIKRHLDLLAMCLGSILTTVDPDLVVIGGGLSNFIVITTQPANRLPRHLLPVARVPHTEQARHGDASGIRGAAFLYLID